MDAKPEYMLIKWIIITPGNALDIFQTSDIVRYFESNTVPRIQKYFNSLFNSTDEIQFKCFTNCKFMNADSSMPESQTYQCGCLCFKVVNRSVKDEVIKKCNANGYSYQFLSVMPW